MKLQHHENMVRSNVREDISLPKLSISIDTDIWKSNYNSSRYFFYKGDSMKGVFQDGDYLSIKQVKKDDISVGDIIVFRSSASADSKMIVHRVIKNIGTNVLITRGDNNLNIDCIPITESNLMGKVECFYRNNQIIWISSFWNNKILADFIELKCRISRLTKVALRIPYTFIRKTGLVKYFWNPKITMVRQAGKKGQIIIKYVANDRTVAYHDFSNNTFVCKKPYDLIISKPCYSVDCPT